MALKFYSYNFSKEFSYPSYEACGCQSPSHHFQIRYMCLLRCRLTWPVSVDRVLCKAWTRVHISSCMCVTLSNTLRSIRATRLKRRQVSQPYYFSHINYRSWTSCLLSSKRLCTCRVCFLMELDFNAQHLVHLPNPFGMLAMSRLPL